MLSHLILEMALSGSNYQIHWIGKNLGKEIKQFGSSHTENGRSRMFILRHSASDPMFGLLHIATCCLSI